MAEVNRRLAGILAADIVGYSRLVGQDEPTTLARVRALRTDVLDKLAAEHDGRLFKTTGDGFFAAFASAVQALRCAIAVQDTLRAQPDGLRLRIGVHQGEVVAEGDDLLGDGVIVAARLEGIAEPGGICISARVREDAAGKVPIEVDDLGTPPLKNISQPIHVFRVRVDAAAPHPAVPRPTARAPDRPSMVVLPFQNMTEDPEQEHFADGIVEDVTSALSNIRWLHVVARNSAFVYKGRAIDIRDVGRDLGARYVLEGSIRRAGSWARITCQLIEAADGQHIWADRFEGEPSDIFSLQDRITESVVSDIEPSLLRVEMARAAAKPAGQLDAYDLLLRALPHVHTMARRDLDAAVALLHRALQKDPGFIRAKALLALVYGHRTHQGLGKANERTAARSLAREAFAAGNDDPEVLRHAAWVMSFMAGDHQMALAALHRSRRLHPYAPQTLSILGQVYCQAGEPKPAIECFQRAMHLAPLDPAIGDTLTGLGIAHLLAGEAAEALPYLQRAVQERPHDIHGHRHLILALTRLDRGTEARAAAERLLQIRPDQHAELPP